MIFSHPFPWRGSFMAILALLVSLGALFVVHKTVARPAETTIEVTSTDGGVGGPECRLRDAISAANASGLVGGCDGSTGGPFIIELKQYETYRFTVVDNSENGLPIVASNITINGHNAHIQRSSEASIPNFRLFQVAVTGTLSLNEVWVINGGYVTEGGGIFNSGNALIHDSIIFNNYAEMGAGILNQEAGKLTISQSHLLYNHGGCGGAISNNGAMTMTDTTLIANVGDI